MSTRTMLFAAVLCLALVCARQAHAVEADKAKGALFAASDGSGGVQLVWYPAYGKWPAGGWRLTDSKGETVAEKVSALEPGALAALSAEDADGVKKLASLLDTTTKPDELGAVYFQLGVVALTDFGKARALGLAWSVTGAPAGQRSYKAVALDKSGKTMYTLTSAEMDPSRPTPPPPPPGELSVKPEIGGAMLFWRPAKQDRDTPVMAYLVERDWSGQSGVSLTDRPLFLGGSWDEDSPAFEDQDAPVEQELTYRVYSLDVLGRRGGPVEAKLFMPDLKALLPPTGLAAEAGEGEVSLSWKPTGNTYTAGYVVERSFANSGIYEALTPQGLPADEDGYRDRDLRGGAYYYYRVRSIGPRGDLGDPTDAVMASPKAAEAPDRPEGLKAEAGPTRVKLTWDAPEKPVAGYIVERRSKGAPRWAVLNPKISAEPRYDDEFNLGEFGTFRYRVTAVGFDNARSEPSSEAEAVLEDVSPPPAPRVTGIDGKGGEVRLTFAPGEPAEKTDRFLVLRGSSPEDAGLVMGDPLPAGARSFEDKYVKPGGDYWYAVVALDAKGRRSQMSERIMVLVGTPDIPMPPAPKARYEAEPFGRVELELGQVPAGLTASVQYSLSESGPWTVLAESLSGEGSAVHANLPESGKIYYRVVYKAASGVQGEPSKAAEITVQ